MTLKIRSRSIKSNQLYSSSQQCIFACLVKIHPLVQKITHGNHISDISKCCCDLENKVKVTKLQSTLSPLPTMYLCKFGQNPSTGSGKQSYIDADANGICTKNNMPPSLQLGNINLSGILVLECTCQTVWIQIRPNILWDLIWVQIVCKRYQQVTNK